MHSLFLALVLYPQVQRRAQAELDAVIGRDRLPTFDDKPHLPYIEAFCKELLRWKMPLPLGTIHSFQVSKSEMTDNDFQALPIRQIGMTCTKDFSFRKVRFLLIVY
jgi:hypothetical protein